MSILFSSVEQISTLDIREIEEYNLEFLKSQLRNFKSLNKIESFHINRQKEFLLGRFSALMNFKNNYHFELTDLDFEINRNPIWPDGFVGSITHSRSFVISAVANKKDLDSLGIDIENIGRVSTSVAEKILIDQDIKFISGLSEDFINTLIFSAKESFYKAIYPKYGHFFGFESAFVSTISIENSTFEINLAVDLNDYFTKIRFQKIKGYFCVHENHIITLIEIPSFN